MLQYIHELQKEVLKVNYNTPQEKLQYKQTAGVQTICQEQETAVFMTAI